MKKKKQKKEVSIDRMREVIKKIIQIGGYTTIYSSGFKTYELNATKEYLNSLDSPIKMFTSQYYRLSYNGKLSEIVERRIYKIEKVK